jgi:hypothetical protein
MALHQFNHLMVRQGFNDPTIYTLHPLVGDERIDDRFIHRLDHGFEYRRQLTIMYELHPTHWTIARQAVLVGRGEGQENIPGSM